jgi:6,7-dimethyl-8-ribityllumazine synthase
VPKVSAKNKIVVPPPPVALAKSGYAAPAVPDKSEFRKTRVAILGTHWNVELVESLSAGARRCLLDWGVQEKHIREFRAPGAFELPLATSALMKTGKYDAVVVVGAVIRGDTPHFEFVAGECSRGLREASVKHGIPLGFGVLTVNTSAQAVERCGSSDTNKGYEAAAAALEMVRLLREVE